MIYLEHHQYIFCFSLIWSAKVSHYFELPKDFLHYRQNIKMSPFIQ